MVALLNLIPFLIATVGLCWIYLGWKKGGDFVVDVLARVLITVAVILAYQHFQPSYFPKGEITRTGIVSEEPLSHQIENNLSKPLSGAERDARREVQYKEKIEFIKQKEVDIK
jgi:hypothetical protein